MTLVPIIDHGLLNIALQVQHQSVDWAPLTGRGIELIVRRDDEIDLSLSGNKFYKLFFSIKPAITNNAIPVASFGGAYSNHLYALAAAGARFGFSTVGFVRGERPQHLSPTLRYCVEQGMRLEFLSRSIYRENASAPTPSFVAHWQEQFAHLLFIAEGGAGVAAAQGASYIARATELALNGQFDYLAVAVGTGTTLAGLATGLATSKMVLGVSVLKGSGDLAGKVNDLVVSQTPVSCVQGANYRLIEGFHAGGYAKKLPQRLIKQWREFETQTGILLDPVYTLKLVVALGDLAQLGYFKKNERIVMVHSGGLQGRCGFESVIDW